MVPLFTLEWALEALFTLLADPVDVLRAPFAAIVVDIGIKPIAAIINGHIAAIFKYMIADARYVV